MENKKKSNKNKPKKSNFLLTCFGFSFEPFLEGENPSKMVINITPTKKKILNSNKKKKKNLIRWFSSSPGLDKVPGGRNTPAATKSKKRAGDDDNSSAGDSDHKRSRRSTKKSSSSKGGDQKANQNPPRTVPDTLEITSPEENPSDQATHGVEERIALGNRKQASQVEAGDNDRCQKRQSFAKKIDALRCPKSQPSSPEVKPKLNRMVPSRSTSFPVLPLDELLVKPVVKSVVKLERSSTVTRNCDSMIGISIMLVTLLILLLWGKVCAILCTCAWLYFVPLLRTMVGQDETTKLVMVRSKPNFDSEEYKKMVVLEGFLERRHRSGV